MRIIVCGSRTPRGHTRLINELDRLAQEQCPLIIVHGGCKTGADREAAIFVRERREAGQLFVTEEVHLADWEKYELAAGPLRNRQMAILGADRCLASWDGKTKGTLHMITVATQHSIPVHILPMSVPQ